MYFSPPVHGACGVDRGSGACAEGVGKLGGKDSFEMLFCRARSRGFNPLPANAVLPLSACAHRGREIFGFQRLRRCGYMLRAQGGEKYSDSSDSVAAAICFAHRGREIFGIQLLGRCGYMLTHTGGISLFCRIALWRCANFGAKKDEGK